MVKCNKCGSFYSDARFKGLVCIGVQEVPAFGGAPGYTLELRNCPCGSTLSLLLGEAP